jgi:hypothetical protein
MTFYVAQEGSDPEPYEHEWQAERRAKEMAASTGRPATFWEEKA